MPRTAKSPKTPRTLTANRTYQQAEYVAGLLKRYQEAENENLKAAPVLYRVWSFQIAVSGFFIPEDYGMAGDYGIPVTELKYGSLQHLWQAVALLADLPELKVKLDLPEDINKFVKEQRKSFMEFDCKSAFDLLTHYCELYATPIRTMVQSMIGCPVSPMINGPEALGKIVSTLYKYMYAYTCTIADDSKLRHFFDTEIEQLRNFEYINTVLL